jgi:hypothetical protein
MSSELSMPLSVVRRFWTGPVELRQDNQYERDARRDGPQSDGMETPGDLDTSRRL